MRFYLIGFFCFSMLFVACGGNDDWRKVPPGIIPEHNFAEMLTEIHIADGSLANYPNADSLAKHGMGLYLAIFKLHHTDSATFRRSLKYFSTRPDLLSEIYTGVNRRLETKADSLKKLKPKADPDSAKKAKAQKTADSLIQVKAKAKIDSITKANKNKPVKASRRKNKLKKTGVNPPNALPQQ